MNQAMTPSPFKSNDSFAFEELRNAIKEDDFEAMIKIFEDHQDWLYADIGDEKCGQSGYKPIHVATFYNIHERLISWMLDQGVDVNEKASLSGETPLLIAVLKRKLPLVHFLLRRNANINAVDQQWQESALMKAAGLGDLEMVKLLISYHPKIHLVNRNNLTAYQLVGQRFCGNSEVKQRIQQMLDNYSLNEERNRLDSGNSSDQTEKEEPPSQNSTPNKEQTQVAKAPRLNWRAPYPSTSTQSGANREQNYAGTKRRLNEKQLRSPPRLTTPSAESSIHFPSPLSSRFSYVRGRSPPSHYIEYNAQKQHSSYRTSPDPAEVASIEIEELQRELKSVKRKATQTLRELNECSEYNMQLTNECTIAKEKLQRQEQLLQVQSKELMLLRERIQLYEGSDEVISQIQSQEKCDEMIGRFRVRLEKFVAQKERITKTQCESLLNCVVCRDRTKSIMFVPCNHLCLCHQCYTNHQLAQCPICRVHIQQHLQVYL